MKKILIPSLCALVLAISCGEKPTTPTNNTNPAQGNTNPAQGNNNAAAPLEPAAQPLPAPKPSVPSTTSFAAVTKHLDAGGDFYLYWNANQLQAFAQDGLEKLEEVLKTEMPPDMRGEADTYMKLAKAAYIESGLDSIDGFGASSFRSGTGLRRHKVMIHRNPAKSDGLMWKALGSAPHELGGLKLMPATTAYAVHADLDVAGTFKWIKGFIASNLPAKQGVMLAEMLEEANAEVPIEKIINATGGELGVYVTLNPKKMIEVDPRMLEMLNIGGGRPEPWDMGEPMPAGQQECSIIIVGIWVSLRLPSSRIVRGLTSWVGRAAYRFIQQAGERCATRPSPRSRPIPALVADAFRLSCPGRPTSRIRAQFADSLYT